MKVGMKIPPKFLPLLLLVIAMLPAAMMGSASAAHSAEPQAPTSAHSEESGEPEHEHEEQTVF